MLVGLIAEDPAVLAAYVLGERKGGRWRKLPVAAAEPEWPLQLGVLFRSPGTCRALNPREKTIRRITLAKKTGELLGAAVEVVDLDNAGRHELRRAVDEGLLLYVRADGEPAHRAFEAYARYEQRRKPGPRVRRSRTRGKTERQ